MLRGLARIWAKLNYAFQQDVEAERASINSKIAAQNAEVSRKLVAQLNAEADGIEKNIEAEEVKLEKGYWECDNGHEWKPSTAFAGIELQLPPKECYECKAPVKLIKLSEMSGQEKYELEKQKKEAQAMVAEKRKMAEQEVENVTQREQASKMLAGDAASRRKFADKIRAL